MKKGKEYRYSYIEKFAEENDYELSEFGHNTIGENFIVLEKANGTLSFVLTGTMGDEYVYECIYKYPK